MNRPWMPLYVNDYLSATMRLTTIEHGAYLLLIMEYWREGGLPNDDAKLAKIAGVKPTQWKRMRPTISGFFDAEWKHKRIDSEITRTAEISNKRKEAAKQMHSKCKAKADTLTLTLTPIKKEEEKKVEADANAPPTPKPRAIRLPNDWKPSADDLAFVKAKGWSPLEIELEATKFRNYWTAKSGRDATKLDWGRTWENWILNARRGTNVSSAREERREQFFDALGKLKAFGRGGGDPGGEVV
jgi:uncharacterized protein YdaU (DUF1376 family)